MFLVNTQNSELKTKSKTTKKNKRQKNEKLQTENPKLKTKKIKTKKNLKTEKNLKLETEKTTNCKLKRLSAGVWSHSGILAGILVFSFLFFVFSVEEKLNTQNSKTPN